MTEFSYKISGLKELENALKSFPVEIAGKVIETATRKGAAVIAAAIRARAPNNVRDPRRKGKRLADSIIVGDRKKVSRNERTSRARFNKKEQGVSHIGFSSPASSLAHLVEYGRRAGISKKGRHYPASPANPFVRTGLDASIGDATEVQIVFLASEIQRVAKKLSKKRQSLQIP
jgi:Bacteriophage HK97-gp10, putative tail-component